MSWKLEICLSRDADQIFEEFETLEDGEAWLREHHPGFFSPRIWIGEGEGFKQFGMNYYWASFVEA